MLKGNPIASVATDIKGGVLKKQTHVVITGNTTIQFSTYKLAAGLYQLFGLNTDGRTNIIRFIKQ